MAQTAEHGQISNDDATPPHRWMRHADPETGAANHWCIDGDTDHHREPCEDAAYRTGEHAGDPEGAAETWPEYHEQNAAVLPVPQP